jgi:putative transposase
MPQKRYTAEQIIPMLRRADVELGQGKKIPKVCKLLGITQQTYYRWRQKYGRVGSSGGADQPDGALAQ